MCRLTEGAAALRAVYEAEAEHMRFEGTLDEALLLKLKHPAPPVDDDDVAVASVLPAERHLCERVLECFAKIAIRFADAFFRFADGVAATAREPQRLFKLLDMLDGERDRLDDLFSGESAALAAIRVRAREVEHALACDAVMFFEFGLRMEADYVSGTDNAGHVPKIVRYAVNYLKCLTPDDYHTST
jgi:hypothetical protein